MCGVSTRTTYSFLNPRRMCLPFVNSKLHDSPLLQYLLLQPDGDRLDLECISRIIPIKISLVLLNSIAKLNGSLIAKGYLLTLIWKQMFFFFYCDSLYVFMLITSVNRIISDVLLLCHTNLTEERNQVCRFHVYASSIYTILWFEQCPVYFYLLWLLFVACHNDVVFGEGWPPEDRQRLNFAFCLLILRKGENHLNNDTKFTLSLHFRIKFIVFSGDISHFRRKY